MSFTIQRPSVRHLTLSIAADGGLHVRFENSTHCKLLTVLQLLDFIQRLVMMLHGCLCFLFFRDIVVYPLSPRGRERSKVREPYLAGELKMTRRYHQ